MKRGLVVSCPIEINGSHMLIRKSWLDEQELRASLLFWDELVWPISRVVMMPGRQDEQFLEGAGILKRPEFSFGGDVAQSMARCQIAAFNKCDSEEPGQWSFSEGDTGWVQVARIKTWSGPFRYVRQYHQEVF